MAALAFSLIISIPIAILAGTHQGKFIDFFAMAFAVLGQSMPTVWLGILNILVFAVFLGIFPAFGYEGPMSLVLPAMTLGYPFAAVVTRMGRSGMIDVLREDYITATIAKGIPRHTVYMKYAFKNAMIPIVTLVGMQIGHFLGGAVVCETNSRNYRNHRRACLPLVRIPGEYLSLDSGHHHACYLHFRLLRCRTVC